ncbi:MAG: phage Gp37/Gp68 family protein [Deltaproteobacteria bacterium]|nr:phage Gp37/Gp68 family protein [Deltaproteobacteria bacterium]
MGESSKIEWTDATWNPVIGCSRVSAGCSNCYAERVAHRGMAEQHRGLTVMGAKGPRWNGDVRFVPHRLDVPLRKKAPQRYFVNSLSDLFHEGLTNEQIAAVFGVMAGCPQHTFQILTKRPGRMAEWFRWAESFGDGYDLLREGMPSGLLTCAHEALSGDAWEDVEPPFSEPTPTPARFGTSWPLPNVWLGVSVEDQLTAELRILELLGTPAALRFVSYEPALGAVDFTDLVIKEAQPPHGPRISLNAMTGVVAGPDDVLPSLDWIIVGGESGPGARPFNIEWALSTIRQGRDAGVAVFVKQLGARAIDGERLDVWCNGEHHYGGRFPGESIIEEAMARPGYTVKPHDVSRLLVDRKGGDWSEWPEDLRVREMPEVDRV